MRQQKGSDVMDDEKIVELYWQRSEAAIAETARKFGSYCRAIAHRILSDREAEEECLNDTWLGAWNSMPPHKPNILSVFLGKITRRLSLSRLEKNHAQKRGGGAYEAALEELEECIPAADSAQQLYDENALTELLREFLKRQSEENKRIFLMRYWYIAPIKTICAECSLGENTVKSRLFRMREQLRKILENEGYTI